MNYYIDIYAKHWPNINAVFVEKFSSRVDRDKRKDELVLKWKGDSMLFVSHSEERTVTVSENGIARMETYRHKDETAIKAEDILMINSRDAI